MRNRLLLAAAYTAVSVVFGAATANADTFWLSQTQGGTRAGNWFAGPGVAYGIRNMPDWNSTSTFSRNIGGPGEIGPSVFSTDTDVFMPGGTIGRVLPEERMPSWFGDNTRISLSGVYIGGETSDREHTPLSNALTWYYTTVSGLAGSTLNIIALGPPFALSERLHVEVSGFELALRATTDYEVRPNFVLSPSVGLFGGWQQTDFDYGAQLTGGGGVATAHEISNVLNVSRVGADIGLIGAWRFRDPFVLSFGGRVGIVWKWANLDSNDCLESVSSPQKRGLPCTTAPGTQPLGGGFGYATSSGDDDSNFGFIGTLLGALSYNHESFVVSVGGFFTWESGVAGVRNPAFTGPLAAFTVPARVAGPSRVRFDGGWNAGGFIVLRIPIGG